MVYVRKGSQLQPLVPPYKGPYRVIEKGPKFFKLDMGGKEVSVTVDQLKLETRAAAGNPARHGCPPAARVVVPPANNDSNSEDSFYSPSTSPAHTPSPGLLAMILARPAREHSLPAKLDLRSATQRSGGSDVVTAKQWILWDNIVG